MSCRDYRDREALLEDLAGGVLTGPAAAEVEAHVAACAECRAAVEAARLSTMVLRTALAPAAEPSGAFWTRLSARLNEVDERRIREREFLPALEWLGRRFAYGAAMALLILGSFLMGMEFGPRLYFTPQPEVRELVPRPEPPPADFEEVLASLASNGNGR
jgi:anti-sigma factor RsiW